MLGAFAVAWVAGGADAAPSHTVALRVRRGGIPQSIMDIWFFDNDDPGAPTYERPAIATNVFGLEYTLAPDPVGSQLIVWVERAWIPMKDGYWDDVESPEDHTDGDWLAPDKLGLWNFGVNYANEIGITSSAAPVWLSASIGAGIGLGIRTGSITVWHPGYHPDTVDPDCGYEDMAPDRVDVCVSDEQIKLPGVVPILDVTVGPKLHITEHAMVRLDLGIHDVLYIGGAAGGTF